MMFALCPACSGQSVTITGMTGHDPPEYPAKQERLNKQGVSTVETPLFDGIFDSGRSRALRVDCPIDGPL